MAHRTLQEKGISLTAGDLRWLKLDCSNDPLTESLTLEKGADNIHLYLNCYSTNNARYGRLYFQKSDHDTAGVMSQTDAGDWLGNIKYLGVNNVGLFAGGGQMTVQQTGVSGAYCPTMMVWTTYSDTGENDNAFVIDDAGHIGLGTDVPSSALEFQHSLTTFTFHNTTTSDTDGSRSSLLDFRGQRTGDFESSLAHIEIEHDGALNDEMGRMIFSINDGNDGWTPTERLRLDSTDVTISNLDIAVKNGAAFTFRVFYSGGGFEANDTGTINSNLIIDGDDDQIQLRVQGHSTQTNNLLTLEQSDGTDVFTVNNSGDTNIYGSLTLGDTTNAGSSFNVYGDGAGTLAFEIDAANNYDITIGNTALGTQPEVFTRGDWNFDKQAGNSPSANWIDGNDDTFQIIKILGAPGRVDFIGSDAFAFKPSADLNDYLTISTVANVPTISTVGTCNLAIAPDGGQVDVTGTLAATTVTGANVTSGADPGHTHTGASLSGIDISDDTNLAVTSPIVLTDDTLSWDFSTNNAWTGTNSFTNATGTVLTINNAAGTNRIFELQDGGGTVARVDDGGFWGINTVSSPTVQMNVQFNSVSATAGQGCLNFAAEQTVARTAGPLIGAQGFVRTQAGSSFDITGAGQLAGILAQSQHRGTGTVALMKGVDSFVSIQNTRTGTITDARCYNTICDAEDGTITTGYGMRINTPLIDNGNIVNWYGLYIGESTGADTVNNEVFIAGAGEIFFRDQNTHIGSLAAGYLDYTTATMHRFVGPGTRVQGDLYIGNNDAANHTLVFDGSGNTGIISWIQASEYFSFDHGVRIGDGGTTNYANFAADGELTLAGTARIRKDYVITPSSVRLGGVAPGQAIVGNFEVLQFAGVGGAESIYFESHVPPDWVTGSDIEVHIHWAPTNANAGDVVWQMDYVCLKPENNEVLTAGVTSTSVTDSTQTLQDELLESGDMTISGAGCEINDVIGIRIYRDPAHASDTYASDASLVLIHFKYLSDKLGEAT